MSQFLRTLNQIVNDADRNGLVHNFTSDETLSGSQITVNEKELINFGSCSYLGLEYHPALKAGAMQALEQYGTQFSSSRAYLSLGLYQELEANLERIFEQPAIVTASTTLGHMATLPVIVEPGDAVILDLQVHASVQLSAQVLKANNIPISIIPHNSMEALENKLKQLQNKHNRVWYMADGVYSMYGDMAPLQELEQLMERYKCLHLYVDDAHGMGWTGTNGIGYVRSQMSHHPKMVMITSLNKAFASAGGVVLLPNEEMKQKIKNCGSTLIFSGPIQPPMLGAAIAASRLLQSEEIKDHQEQLRQKIAYTNERLEALGLPQYKASESPLFFIPVGLHRITIVIVKQMKEKGFYLNAAGYPAVPIKRSGIRFMINNNLSYQEIDAMLVALQEAYTSGILSEGSSPVEVAKSFRIPAFQFSQPVEKIALGAQAQVKSDLTTSVASLDHEEWQHHFEHTGSHTYANLLSLERSFSNNKEKEKNAKFYYSRITDERGELILLGVFICFLTKNDMLSDPETSRQVEVRRKADAYFQTSYTVMTGTPFSVGKTVLLNTANPHWKKALEVLTQQMQQVAERENADKIVLKDIESSAPIDLKNRMLDLGFLEYQLPNYAVVQNLNWNSQQEFERTIGNKYRNNFRKEIAAYADRFIVNYDKPKDKATQKRFYELYKNVHSRAFVINDFEMPYRLFEAMYSDPSYDIVSLSLKTDPEAPVAVLFSYRNGAVYNALLVGLDYDKVYSDNCYKQMLYQSVLRAKALGCQKLDLAYTAEMEKKKVGATICCEYGYIQAREHLSAASLSMINQKAVAVG